jgi:hypothetical protein
MPEAQKSKGYCIKKFAFTKINKANGRIQSTSKNQTSPVIEWLI